MFGTRSMVITAVARSRTSFARSRKVPAGAYTSIMGMLLARALDDPGDVLRPRDEHEMPSGQFGHARMHPLRHEALELRIIARSCVATTYHDGTVFQAGAT